MSIRTVLILAVASLLLSLLPAGRLRTWLAAAACALGVYWLQPALPIRGLDFWLPGVTLGLTAAAWLITLPAQDRRLGRTWQALACTLGLVLLVALTRFLALQGLVTASRPPAFDAVLAGLLLIGLVVSAAGFLPCGRFLLAGLLGMLLLLFILQKTPALTLLSARWLRLLSEQDASLAAGLDLRWLGFSYIAFRLIHTIRNRQAGRLPAASFPEYLTFILFFPALPAGPIDRLERFLPDLRLARRLEPGTFLEGSRRIAVGLFKKFVIADLLSLIALNPNNASQVHGAGWMWIALYAFSFQIFFDFSGYTDIAVGMGRWMGISLPENFNHPYLQPNLARFWDSWHMSLTRWFRSYVYNPLTRRLLRSRKLPAALVMLTGQAATMVLIGMWHGVTWNFLIWGLWQAAGLFAASRLGARLSSSAAGQPGLMQKLRPAAGALLTFHYVALGWVWFVLPDPASAARVFVRLAGG